MKSFLERLFRRTPRQNPRLSRADHFISLAENSPYFIGICDNDMQAFFVNDAGKRMVGIEDRKVAELQVSEFFYPEDRKMMYDEFFPRVVREGSGEVEIRFRHFRTSQPIWMLYNVFAVGDASGERIGFATVSRNITSEIRAREALVAAERRQSLLVRLLEGQRETSDPDAMMMAAAEAVGRELRANRVGFFEMPDADTLAFTISWTDGVLEKLSGHFPAAGIGSGYLAKVRAGQTLGFADTSAEPLTADSQFPAMGARAIIGAPIIRGGLWHAGLYVNHSQVREWTPDEISLVREVADHTWDAVERARARIALHDTAARLEAALSATEVATFMWDVTNDRVVPDRNLARMFSVAPEDAGGVTFDRYVAAIHPDDRERVRAAVEAGIAGGHYETDYRVVRPDGSIRWVASRGRVERDAQGHVHFPGVVIDITERKRAENALRASEERFRQVADLTPQFIWVTRADGTLEYVNQQWIAYSGLDLAQSAVQENVDELIHPDDRALVAERWSESVRTGSPVEIEVRLRSRGDEFRWFLARTVALRDEKGRVVRWFTTSTDIHEQKEAARALQEIDHRKDEFLATLSHELRTPLTAGFGWVKLLDKTRDPDLLDTGLAAIEQSFTTQIRLIDDLLDVSRIVAGKMKIEMIPMDLAEAIEAAVDTVRPTASLREIEIRQQMEPNCIVRGDVGRLTQIVWNLLSNAIKFSTPGSAVDVTLARVSGTAQITIRDRGQGIDSAFLPYVFDRFRQADSSVSRRQGGLGLGLAIVASLVEAHGGTVHADSEGLGRGATFTVTIPLLKRTDVAPVRDADENAGPGSDIEGARVMVVDDDDSARDLIRTILEEAGADVFTCSSAEEAVDALGRWRADVLISDLSMPLNDGFSLIRMVRRAGNNVPAIAVTAYVRSEAAAREAGFHGYLPKPFTPDALIAAIRALPPRG